MPTNPRELPKNFHTLITPTGFPDAVAQLLQMGTIPVRRRRVYRIVYNNRYLWLRGNKTTFNTRPSAKDAVAYWVYRILNEEAERQAATPDAHRYSPRLGALAQRLETVLAPLRTDTANFVCNYVKGLFDTGVLRLEETEMDQMTPTEA